MIFDCCQALPDIPNLFLQLEVFIFKAPDLLILFLEDRVEPLDGCQGHTAGIDHVDEPVALSYIEGSLEVLRHGTDVTNGGTLVLIIPGRNRDARKAREDLFAINRRNVLLQVAVAGSNTYTEVYACLACPNLLIRNIQRIYPIGKLRYNESDRAVPVRSCP